MQKLKKAFIINVCIVCFEVIAILWMVSGISSGVFSASKLAMFRYFTVDSNILMGIIALIAVIDEWRVLKGRKSRVSDFTYVIKLMGTVGVTLTMLVTIFFLAPNSARVNGIAGFLSLFYYSNFFLHLLNPVLSIVVFLLFERTDRIAFVHTFTGIIPVVIYAAYYVEEALTHIENGAIARGYDWYGFFILGINSAYVVLPIILAVTYGISAALWRLNRRKYR